MVNFAGLNGPPHTGYHVLCEHAASWPVTANTPDGPAGLLSVSRDLYAQGYYAYALLSVAGVWSIFAVEAALRARLGVGPRVALAALVRQAERQRLTPPAGWKDERLDAGRKLRNSFVHGGQHQFWTPAMAQPVLAAAHEAVAALFPAAEVEPSAAPRPGPD